MLDPRNDEALKFMHANSKAKKSNQKPTPPQIFNGEDYCGVSNSICSKIIYATQEPHSYSQGPCEHTGCFYSMTCFQQALQGAFLEISTCGLLQIVDIEKGIIFIYDA